MPDRPAEKPTLAVVGGGLAGLAAAAAAVDGGLSVEIFEQSRHLGVTRFVPEPFGDVTLYLFEPSTLRPVQFDIRFHPLYFLPVLF